MSLERYANSPTPSTPSVPWATLDGGIAAGDTSITFSTVTPFPSAAQFRLLIESELLLVTNLVGLVGTVTRGVEGTTAASHANSTGIYGVLTAAAQVLNPRSMTTTGDTEYLASTGAPARLAVGANGSVLTAVSGLPAWSAASATAGQVLVSGGAGAPTWFAPTAGSVLFAGVGGIAQYDSASLFFDDTNNLLVVSANAATLQAAPAGFVAQFAQANATNTGVLIDTYGGFSVQLLRRANGTSASPTAITSAQILGLIASGGYGASAYANLGARVSFIAEENWTNTANGTAITFNTVANGAVGTGGGTERMRISNAGNVSVNSGVLLLGTTATSATTTRLYSANTFSTVTSNVRSNILSDNAVTATGGATTDGYIGLNTQLSFGTGGVASIGQGVGFESGVFVDGNGNANSEFVASILFNSSRIGTGRTQTTVSGKYWIQDNALQGPIGTQPTGLGGITTVINNHYDGSPSVTASYGEAIITKTLTGEGRDATFDAANTYPVDVGLFIGGDSTSGTNTIGFTTGIQIGGAGSNWGLTSSKIGSGIDISQFLTRGIYIHSPTSTPTADIEATGKVIVGTLSVTGATVTLAEATNIVAGTTTGTKIGTATTQKLGFYNSTPVVQQTDGAALTNNVTSGGTTDTIATYTDLIVYTNDAAAIRNNFYQLARKMKIVDDALRTYGLLS